MSSLALVSQFFPPESNAPANRIGVVADALGRHTPLVVHTLEPSYPDPTRFESVDVAALDALRDYPVHRLSSFRAHGGLIRRAVREIGMARGLVAAASGADALWISAPSMFLIPEAAGFASKHGVPLVVDVRDLSWEYARDVAAGRGFPYSTLAGLTAKRIVRALRQAQLVLVTNGGAAAALIEAGVEASRLLELSNGIDKQRFDQLGSLPPVVPTGPLRVSYCGLVGMTQGLGTLLDAAGALPDIQVTIAGAGPELAELRERARAERLDNVRLPGQVDWEQIRQIYADSDVLFAQLRGHSSLSDTAVPSKIFEYMAAGRATVYAGGGVAARIVEESGGGISLAAGDVRALIQTLEGLSANPSGRSEMAAAARTAAGSWIREDLVEAVVPEALSRIGRI